MKQGKLHASEVQSRRTNKVEELRESCQRSGMRQASEHVRLKSSDKLITVDHVIVGSRSILMKALELQPSNTVLLNNRAMAYLKQAGRRESEWDPGPCWMCDLTWFGALVLHRSCLDFRRCLKKPWQMPILASPWISPRRTSRRNWKQSGHRQS